MRFLILLLFPFFSLSQAHANTGKDSVLLTLFETLNHKEDYVREKEQRIEDIKKLLIMPDISDKQRYILNNRIQEEYSAYQIDSATHYLECNMRLAYRMDNQFFMVDTKLKLSFMYWQSGKFFEAVQQIASINRSQLDTMPVEYLYSYYNAYKRLYKYMLKPKMTDNDYFRLVVYMLIL
jgi:hypothetical protein